MDETRQFSPDKGGRRSIPVATDKPNVSGEQHEPPPAFQLHDIASRP
jgi:hypothetical protein